MEKNKKKLSFQSFGRFQKSELDFQEVQNSKEWISYGKKNDLPQELLRLYNSASPLHSAIIDKKAQMTSTGFDLEKIISINEKLFFKNRFSKDNLNELANKVAFDLAIFNGFYLNIIWDGTGNNIAQINHIPFERVRAAKSNDDEIQNYYVSRNWEEIRKDANKPKLYPGFSQELAQNTELDAKSQIYAVQIYAPGMDYYTLPAYKSCVNTIKTLYEATLFSLKSIQKGFSAGMVMINKGVFEEEEKKEIYDDIKKNYTTADEAGDFIAVFVEDPEMAPEFVPIELQNTSKRFLDLKNQATEELIQGHKANSAVAGREVSGKLSASKELIDGHIIFQKTVIDGMQKQIEDAFNYLATFNKIENEIFKLNKFELYDSNQINTEEK